MAERSNKFSPARRGFTAMEMMIVVLIMSIVSVVGMDTISSVEANQRSDRAAREALAFFRYARHQAMVTGRKAKVQITPSTGTFAVYWMSNGSTWDVAPVSMSMVGGGSMQINMTTAQELAGTTMAVTAAGTTEFVYGPLGATVSDSTISTYALTGTLTFTFGSRTKSLVIPAVGDPQLN